MSDFKFEQVYETLARPLDNRPVPTDPFGPMLVKVLSEEDGIFVLGTLQPAAIQAYFASEEGTEHLAYLIEEMLGKQGKDFCIVKVYECYNDASERTHKGIALCIHHKSGIRMGYLPIDSDRISHYAPLLDENVELVPVRIDVKPLH
jgi:hypothetical protein